MAFLLMLPDIGLVILKVTHSAHVFLSYFIPSAAVQILPLNLASIKNAPLFQGSKITGKIRGYVMKII